MTEDGISGAGLSTSPPSRCRTCRYWSNETHDEGKDGTKQMLPERVKNPSYLCVRPLPCPFCGADGECLEQRNPFIPFGDLVVCHACGAAMPARVSTDSERNHTAIEGWNRRANVGSDASASSSIASTGLVGD